MNTSHFRPRLRGVLLLLFLAVSSLAQEVQQPFIVETDVMIPMRDGIKLAANIFRPGGEGRFPTILMRTPYGKPDEKSGDAKPYIAGRLCDGRAGLPRARQIRRGMGPVSL